MQIQFVQDATKQENMDLNTRMKSKTVMLDQLQDEHTIVLAAKVNSEKHASTLVEEKIALEQQVAAITAEQLQHVVDLEGKVATLEKAMNQQCVDSAEANLKVHFVCDTAKLKLALIHLAQVTSTWFRCPSSTLWRLTICTRR